MGRKTVPRSVHSYFMAERHDVRIWWYNLHDWREACVSESSIFLLC